jgi:PPOX class probable F420-dependent enzyme
MTHALITADHEAIFKETFIGLFSTLRHKDGFISTNPVNYYWNGAAFEISTLKSRVKYPNLVEHPQATLCVVSPRDFMRYVEVRGRVELQEDPDRALMKEGFRRFAGVDPPENLDPPGSARVMIFLYPEQVSSPSVYGGRFDKATG